ncbi:16S rRNA pseudouridine(516) synthase, partial [Enterococcus faecium]|nr:16S rRNA pseudouridine(516) synthase [Enterococcus faecium]
MIKDKLIFVNDTVVKTGRVKVDPVIDEVRLK